MQWTQVSPNPIIGIWPNALTIFIQCSSIYELMIQFYLSFYICLEIGRKAVSPSSDCLPNARTHCKCLAAFASVDGVLTLTSFLILSPLYFITMLYDLVWHLFWPLTILGIHTHCTMNQKLPYLGAIPQSPMPLLYFNMPLRTVDVATTENFEVIPILVKIFSKSY